MTIPRALVTELHTETSSLRRIALTNQSSEIILEVPPPTVLVDSEPIGKIVVQFHKLGFVGCPAAGVKFKIETLRGDPGSRPPSMGDV